jgi:pimeloyl-ACP methyl ester carboxylesterase
MPAGLADATADLVARIASLATRQVVSVAGRAMVWRSFGAGPPLVLLHGASGSWTHWLRNVVPLAARFRVLAPDMPGFGDSDTPPEPHTAEGLAALVADAIDLVVPPPAPLDIAGFSFGGIVGTIAAARLGRRVGTLVLLGAGGLGIEPAPIRPLHRVRPGMTAGEVFETHRENLRILMLGDPGRADDLAVRLQIENLRRARFKSGAIPTSDALLRALPRVQARLAGIWARRDAFVGATLEARRRAIASIRPDVDVHVIERAGHWMTYETPEEVNALLLDLLTGADGRERGKDRA